MSLSVLLVLFCVILGIYFMAMSRVADAIAASRQRWYLFSFIAGLVAVLATLIPSPLLFGPNYRFTANMGQFLLAFEIGPPLLLLGMPSQLLQPLMRWDAIGRRLAAVIPVGVISSVLMLGWHVPAPFEAASGDLTVWLLKQVTLCVAGLIGWWPVTGSLRAWRPSYPIQLGFLALMRLPMMIMGAFLTFADRLIYTARPFGVEICAPASLADQQGAGVVMWSGGGMILFVVFSIVFALWTHTEDSAGASPP
jgi:putative membrane protein